MRRARFSGPCPGTFVEMQRNRLAQNRPAAEWRVVAESADPDAWLEALTTCIDLGIRPTGLALILGSVTIDVGDQQLATRLVWHLRRRGFSTASPIARVKHASSLSGRERQLLIHLSHGLVHKEAAAAMGVSVATAREYWGRIKRKWQVRTVAEATGRFLRPGS